MVSDFVELGIAAVDKLVDQHFHRIPDRAFFPEREVRKFRKRRRNKDRSRSNSPSDENASPRERSRRHDSQDDYSEDGNYTDGVYDASRNPISRTDPYWQEAERRTRDRHAPASIASDADPRYPARHGDPSDASTREYSDYAPLDTHHSAPYGTYNPPVVEDRHLRRRSHSPDQQSSYRSRPPLKQRSSSLDRSGPKKSSHFSNTDRGLGAGSLGALAGGFVAQEWRKRDKRGKKTDPILLTLVGAAIGGLGANALEGRWERGKEKQRERDRSARPDNR